MYPNNTIYPRLNKIVRTLQFVDANDNDKALDALGTAEKIQIKLTLLNIIFTGQFIGACSASLASICFPFHSLASACAYILGFGIHFKMSKQKRLLCADGKSSLVFFDETAPDRVRDLMGALGVYDDYFSGIDEEKPESIIANLSNTLEEVEKDVSRLDSSFAIAIGALAALLLNSSYSYIFDTEATPSPQPEADIFFSEYFSFLIAFAPSLFLGGKSRNAGVFIGGAATFFQAGTAAITQRLTHIAPSF